MNRRRILVIGRRCGSISKDTKGGNFSIRQVEPYTVSKRHCTIERLADSVIVHDLGGKYGLLVNDQRIGGRAINAKSIELAKGQHDLVLGPREGTIRFKLIID
ncbi:MAG: FHA domain-containing protein [Lentimonas sp.]